MSKEILNFLSHYTTYEYKGPHEILAGGVTPWIGHVIFADMLIRAYRPQSVFGNFSFYSYKKACGQKKTVRGSKNSRRLSNGTPAI